MSFINNLAYEASAGSGKTFMLVVRYLSLLFKGADSSKILALTFTNKAAHEMQERVVLTLEELENRGELDEIVKVTGLSREYLLQNRKRVLDEFLNSHTKIMTIDSFFTQILRKFSLYASLMPNFSTMSSQHELKLLSRFLKEVSVSGKREILINLSLQSKKRVTDIFTLLDEFYVKKEELSHLKFQKQETWQYEKEAMDALEGLRNIVDNCSGASATLKKSVIAENFEGLVLKSWIGRESLKYRTFAKCFTPEMDIYLRSIQEAITKHSRAKEQNFFYALSELVEMYEKAKKALYMDDSELSFSDVTSLVYQILNLLDDSQFLYFRLDAQIEHILLDEFQDTSILQYEILKPLINEITSGSGVFDDGSFFFVGDVKQSIYRFRGGVSALFEEVARENNTKVDKLLINYRSQKEVVEFVNRIFSDKIRNYTPQLTRPEANGGFVEVIQNDELIEESINQVKKFISLGADLNEIAILCATNQDGEAVKEELLKQNIEVVTETSTKLINQRSVKAVIEYLKYLYFKEDIYRYNFFALISREVKKIHLVDLKRVKLFDIVRRVISEYELFSDDFHLLRFLNSVSNYSDIEAFLFEYERLDTTAAASDLSGVRVLTVHKSKGLEYENVIVMDRLKKAPVARDAIIYEYNGIKLKNIYLRIRGRDSLDKDYANAILKEKNLVYEDKLNSLYVAFTRAKTNLILIAKSKDSYFDILELEEARKGEPRCDSQKRESAPKKMAINYKALYYGTQSDILSLEPKPKDDYKAINFGIAIHYMLEMMGKFKEENLKDAKDIMVNRYGYSLMPDEIEDIHLRVNRLINNQEFLFLISDGEYFREKGIRYKKSLRYLDLLVKKEDGSWIVIDYKSSTLNASEHIKQVSFYVKALKEITSDKVDGYICYLLEDDIKIVQI